MPSSRIPRNEAIAVIVLLILTFATSLYGIKIVDDSIPDTMKVNETDQFTPYQDVLLETSNSVLIFNFTYCMNVDINGSIVYSCNNTISRHFSPVLMDDARIRETFKVGTISKLVGGRSIVFYGNDTANIGVHFVFKVNGTWIINPTVFENQTWIYAIDEIVAMRD